RRSRDTPATRPRGPGRWDTMSYPLRNGFEHVARCQPGAAKDRRPETGCFVGFAPAHGGTESARGVLVTAAHSGKDLACSVFSACGDGGFQPAGVVLLAN